MANYLCCEITKGLFFSFLKNISIALTCALVRCVIFNAHFRQPSQNPFLQTISNLCVSGCFQQKPELSVQNLIWAVCWHTHLGHSWEHLICTSWHFGFTFPWVHFGRIYFFHCPHPSLHFFYLAEWQLLSKSLHPRLFEWLFLLL